MKNYILGTGLSGLVGSRIVELLFHKYHFEDLSIDTGVDITNYEAVFNRFQNSQSKWVLHLAAKTDVDSCEDDKKLGTKGDAWIVNVEGTRNIVTAAINTHKKVLFISTDFVFEGKDTSYDENNTPKPINWYGVTKYEGEKIVLTNKNNLIVRITYPYRAKCFAKKDFVHRIFQQLKEKKSVSAISDMIFSPTLIDDIAYAIDLLLQENKSGIYHVVGSSHLSSLDAAIIIAEKFALNKNLIKDISAHKFYHHRAERPLLLRTKNDKIKALGFFPKTFAAGLDNIIKQGFI